MKTSDNSEIMSCHAIQPGMLFEPCPEGVKNSWRKNWNDPDAKKTWKVIERCKDHPNEHKSLYYCSPMDNEKRIDLMCFDQIFRAEEHNFRFPDEAP